MNKNPLGGHFRINDQLSVDRAIEIARDEGHITDTMADNLAGTVRLKTEAGVQYAVFRQVGWEPGEYAPGTDRAVIRKGAIDAWNLMRGWQATHSQPIHYMVNCEQGWSDERNYFYAELIDHNGAQSSPIGLVVGNYNSGGIPSGQGNDENAWLQPGAVTLLKALTKHKYQRLEDGTYANILGIHNYTGLFPWIASNGGTLDPQWSMMWPTIDWTKPQWHLGREWQGIQEIAGPVLRIEQPWMIITEGFFDDMRDVVDAYQERNGAIPLPPGVQRPRAWRTLIPFWQKSVPGVTKMGALLHDFHRWIWLQIYAKLGNVIGAHVFLYGFAPDWENFRVDNDKDYADLNEKFAPATETLPPKLPVPPPGSIAKPRQVDVPKDFVNVRDMPTTKGSQVVGTVNDLAWVLVYLDDPSEGWYYITTDKGVRGWVSTQNGAVKFLELPAGENRDLLELIDDVILTMTELAKRITVLENRELVTKTDMVKYAEDIMLWSGNNFVSLAKIREAVKE